MYSQLYSLQQINQGMLVAWEQNRNPCPKQMLNRSQLNACRFRKKTRHKNLPSKLAFAGDAITVAVHLDSRAISQKE